MPYSTYEDARAREAELMRSAQKVKIGSVPREERRPIASLSRILEIVRLRPSRAQKPAIGKA
jgi:hypothetical protein